MKKYILRIFLIEIIVLIIYSGRCHANSINSINMDIDIDKYGNGYITEEWDVTLDNGTEGYRVISTKNEFSSYDISSFYVEKDNRRYEYLDTWDTEANFQQKSYKCGIIEKDQSIELCWGISEYGKNKYVLRYKVKNFVTQYKDNQGIYYDLLNIKQTVNNVKVKIHSDICKLSLNNSRIWAFGYDGSINFNDEGEIVLDSEGILNSNQKMVTLIRFQKDIFDINGKSYYTFDNVYESAIKSVKLSESQIFIKKIFGILKYFGYIFILLIPFIIIIKIRKLSVNCEKEIYEEGKELPLDSEIEYYRDIPCNGDFDRIYWIAHKYEIVKESQLKRGLIGAILLKKIKENVITVTKNKNGFLNLSDNNYSIDLSNITVSENNSEKHVIYALKKAAGDNLILEPNEFERLCKKYYYYITRIFEKLESSESDKLSSEKYIEKITINETKLFKTNKIKRFTKDH